MYHVMAIANYEDRFVIPTTHREYAENTFNVRGGCGFSLRQRLLRRHQRGEPVRQREETHHSHQGGGLSMLDSQRTRPASQQPARAGRAARLPRRASCAATCPRCATSLRARSARCRAARLAELDALIDALAARRSARGRGRLRRAVRPRPRHLAAPVRARARRLARPRPGDDRPGADLREGRPATSRQASCPTTCRVVLEFASTQPPREARAFLGEMAHILNAIFSALQQARQRLRQRARRAAGAGRREGAAGRSRPPTSRWTRAGPSRRCSTAARPRARPGPASRNRSTSSARTTPPQGARA